MKALFVSKTTRRLRDLLQKLHRYNSSTRNLVTHVTFLPF